MTVEARGFLRRKKILQLMEKKKKKNQRINPLHYLPYGGPELRVFGLVFYIF